MMVSLITNTPEPVIRSTYTLGMIASRLDRLKAMAPFFGISFDEDNKSDGALEGEAADNFLRSVGI